MSFIIPPAGPYQLWWGLRVFVYNNIFCKMSAKI